MQTEKPTIVLVDDSEAMRDFFAQVAIEADFRLLAYASADASLDFLQHDRPALLFLNVMMPNKDGYTFLKELRGNELHSETQIVMISSKDYAQDRVAAKELGVLEFVAKPVSKKSLRTIIEKYVGSGSVGA